MAKKSSAQRFDAGIQAQLGEVIRAYRRQLGVTQEELAWRASLHRTYIADVERGARNVTLRSIVNLAAALEITVGHLLSCATAPGGSSLGAGSEEREAAPAEILMVEDSAADAALTMRAFKRARLTNPLRIVCDAEEGLAYLFGEGRYAKRRPERPGLILLDLNLPGMSGLECLRRIKADAQTRDIPVAVLTVSQSDRMIVECVRLGAENYIVKPLSMESFVRVTPKLNLHLTLSALGAGERRGLSI